MFGWNDDKCLIDACRAGKTEAFGVLVRRDQERLYPTVLRRAGCTEEAQDLLQDAVLRAFEELDRFQGEGSFYTWVYRIAANLALSGYRRRRVASRWREHSGRNGTCAGCFEDSKEGDPSAPLERGERHRLIQEALNALHDAVTSDRGHRPPCLKIVGSGCQR